MAVALLFKEMNWFPFVSYSEKWNFDETAPLELQTDRLTERLLEVTDRSGVYTVRLKWHPEFDPAGSFHVFLFKKTENKLEVFGTVREDVSISNLYHKDTRDFQQLRRYLEECIYLVNLLSTDYVKWKEKFRGKTVTEAPYLYCLVGNIVNYRLYGENKEPRKGVKVFSAGTKVYCFPPLWGDGYESIKVIGKPKDSAKLITVIIAAKYVTNWRLQKVYNSYVVRTMLGNDGWEMKQESKTVIENMLKWLPERTEQAEGSRQEKSEVYDEQL